MMPLVKTLITVLGAGGCALTVYSALSEPSPSSWAMVVFTVILNAYLIPLMAK